MRLPGRVSRHPQERIDKFVRLIERIVRGAGWCGKLNQKQVNKIKIVMETIVKKNICPNKLLLIKMSVNVAIMHYQEHFEFPSLSSPIRLNEYLWY